MSYKRKKLKCTVISDTHSAHDRLKLPGGDILFHCGDMTYLGQEDEVYPFLDWMGDQDYKHKVLIAGNHDYGFESKRLISGFERGYEIDKEFGKNLIDATVFRGIDYLDEECIEIEGYKIYGSPRQPAFNNWAFQYDPSVADDIWARIPLDTDIVMTHGPMKGVLDENVIHNQTASMWTRDYRCGCPALKRRLKLVQPSHHLFGHIHEPGGQRKRTMLSGKMCLSINAACCSIPYEDHNYVKGMTFYLPRRDK